VPQCRRPAGARRPAVHHRTTHPQIWPACSADRPLSSLRATNVLAASSGVSLGRIFRKRGHQHPPTRPEFHLVGGVPSATRLKHRMMAAPEPDRPSVSKVCAANADRVSGQRRSTLTPTWDGHLHEAGGAGTGLDSTIEQRQISAAANGRRGPGGAAAPDSVGRLLNEAFEQT